MPGVLGATAPGAPVPPYRPASRRARIVTGFLIAIIVAEVGMIVLEAFSLTLGEMIFSSRALSDAEAIILVLWSGALIVVGVGLLIAEIGAGIMFLAWQSRTVANIPALVGRRPVQTPGWSIAWWFIPLASFFKPFESVRDAGRQMASSANLHDRLIGRWWILWVAYCIASAVYGAIPTDTAGEWLASGILGMGTGGLGVIAAISAVQVIRTLQSDAEGCAAALSAADGSGSAAAL